MQHNDPLTVLRNHAIAVDGAQASPGTKAVEIERALQRAGFTIIGTDVVAAFACVAQSIGCTAFQWQALLCKLGLAKIVPFDPEKHNAGDERPEVGSSFLEYSPAMMEAMRHSAPVLKSELH